MPLISRPRQKKSMPWVGENTTPVFGALNQPPSAAPPRNQLEFKKMPPKRTPRS